jgi:hypothetical protein
MQDRTGRGVMHLGAGGAVERIVDIIGAMRGLLDILVYTDDSERRTRTDVGTKFSIYTSRARTYARVYVLNLVYARTHSCM